MGGIIHMLVSLNNTIAMLTNTGTCDETLATELNQM